MHGKKVFSQRNSKKKCKKCCKDNFIKTQYQTKFYKNLVSNNVMDENICLLHSYQLSKHNLNSQISTIHRLQFGHVKY